MKGLEIDGNRGKGSIVLGLIGDTHSLDAYSLLLDPDAERIMRVQEPFKKASLKFTP